MSIAEWAVEDPCGFAEAHGLPFDHFFQVDEPQDFHHRVGSWVNQQDNRPTGTGYPKSHHSRSSSKSYSHSNQHSRRHSPYSGYKQKSCSKSYNNHNSQWHNRSSYDSSHKQYDNEFNDHQKSYTGKQKQKKEVVYSSVNRDGNIYTKYSDGGYRYRNFNIDSKERTWTSNYYSPNGGNAAFYRSSGKKGTSFYQNKHKERKYFK